MFLPILTLTLCLTKAFVYENPETTSLSWDYSNEPIYNVNAWVIHLQLQRCALVAIGLKYFAIFVEDEILGNDKSTVHRKFFLGICQQDVLEEWNFCSTHLAEKRKYKCRFKLKDDKFQPRVHRRFCDFKVMVRNKDCKCGSTIFDEPLIKVKGFPTCYMPPIPNSLCKYNVCGLNQCTPVTVEDRIHTVNCSSDCESKDMFCEHPLDRTSRYPEVRSIWSKWKSESHKPADGKRHSSATCINKYTNKGDLDCLGPGTGCCPKSEKNCTCNTYEENYVLKVNRTIFSSKQDTTDRPCRSVESYPIYNLFIPPQRQYYSRHLRETNNDEDDEDDDDDDDDDDDIVLEENPENEVAISTTEELDKEEAVEELNKAALQEVKNATANVSMVHSNCPNIFLSKMYLVVGCICFKIIYKLLGV